MRICRGGSYRSAPFKWFLGAEETQALFSPRFQPPPPSSCSPILGWWIVAAFNASQMEGFRGRLSRWKIHWNALTYGRRGVLMATEWARAGKLRRTKALLSLDPRIIASSSLDRTVGSQRRKREAKESWISSFFLRLSKHIVTVLCSMPGVCKKKKMFYLFYLYPIKICRSLMKLKDSRNALEIVDVIYLWVIRYWKKFFSIKGKKEKRIGRGLRG